MNAVQSESAYYPKLFERTRNSVFVRSNVVETEKQEEDGTTKPWYTFGEVRYDIEEWEVIRQDMINLDVELRLCMIEMGVV